MRSALLTVASDKTFGFDTAVATARVAIDAAHAEARSVDKGIGLVKIMGRSAGFLAAQATLASHEVNACLIPEAPFNMDGGEGPRAQSTRAFARNLAKLTAVPLIFWDERLSTAGVERDMIAADVSRLKRAKAVDKLAAAWILQSALDALA